MFVDPELKVSFSLLLAMVCTPSAVLILNLWQEQSEDAVTVSSSREVIDLGTWATFSAALEAGHLVTVRTVRTFESPKAVRTTCTSDLRTSNKYGVPAMSK